jgi:hypothetical protein
MSWKFQNYLLLLNEHDEHDRKILFSILGLQNVLFMERKNIVPKKIIKNIKSKNLSR